MAISQVRAADTYQRTAGAVPGNSRNQQVEPQAGEQRRREAGASPAVVADISSEARESARVERDMARNRAVEGAEQRQSNRIDAYV